MRAVLFDVDGVLIDSYGGYRKVWGQWSEARELDFPTVWAATHGRRPIDAINDVAPHLDPAFEYEQLRTIMHQIGDQFPPMPGAAALTSSLPAAQWGVVTSGQKRTVLRRFEQSGIPSPTVFIDGSDVVIGKPDPAGYLLGGSLLGADPVQCLVVEDAPDGVRAGKAAGMTVLAVATTHTTQELHGADHIVNDLQSGEVTIRQWLVGN